MAQTYFTREWKVSNFAEVYCRDSQRFFSKRLTPLGFSLSCSSWISYHLNKPGLACHVKNPELALWMVIDMRHSYPCCSPPAKHQTSEYQLASSSTSWPPGPKNLLTEHKYMSKLCWDSLSPDNPEDPPIRNMSKSWHTSTYLWPIINQFVRRVP